MAAAGSGVAVGGIGVGLGKTKVEVALGVEAVQAVRMSEARNTAAPGRRGDLICSGLSVGGLVRPDACVGRGACPSTPAPSTAAGSLPRIPHLKGSVVARGEHEDHRTAARLGVEILGEFGLVEFFEVAAVGVGCQFVNSDPGVLKELLRISYEYEAFRDDLGRFS